MLTPRQDVVAILVGHGRLEGARPVLACRSPTKLQILALERVDAVETLDLHLLDLLVEIDGRGVGRGVQGDGDDLAAAALDQRELISRNDHVQSLQLRVAQRLGADLGIADLPGSLEFVLVVGTGQADSQHAQAKQDQAGRNVLIGRLFIDVSFGAATGIGASGVRK